MSSCILFIVNVDGDVVESQQFKNSWGGAALIWDYFTEKYFPLPAGKKSWERQVGMFANLQPIWDLQDREDLPEEEYAVLLSTFDNVMVKREDLEYLADCFETVLRDMPPYLENYSTRANHMQAEADAFRKLAKDPTVQAVCWQQTTVSEDMWWESPEEPENYDDLTEEEQKRFDNLDGKPYNINMGQKHWFLFHKEDDKENEDEAE